MQYIKKLRLALDITQDEMALLLNTTKGQLAMVEIGQRSLPTEAMIRSAKMEMATLDSISATYTTQDEDLHTLENKGKTLNQFLKQQQYTLARLQIKMEKITAALDAAHLVGAVGKTLITEPIWPDNSLSADIWAILERKAQKKHRILSPKLCEIEMKIKFLQSGIEKLTQPVQDKG